MQINRRITNGLAWAGLFLVVGIPAADLLSAQFMGETEGIAVASVPSERSAPMPAPLSQRPAAPTQVALVPPAKPAAAPAAARPAAADPVDGFLASGRKLPSYITGGDAAAPAAPAETVPTQIAAAPEPVVPVTAAPVASAAAVLPASEAAAKPAPDAPEIDPIEVASLGSQKIAPVPMPLAMRPVNQVVAARPTNSIDATNPLGVAPVVAPSQNAQAYPPIGMDDLEDWETGPLSDFLAERQNGRTPPSQRADRNYDSNYDRNGFFLSDGPNNSRPQRDRLVGPADDGFFLPFVN
ncbi:hypothetical protein VW29_08960 [Devosia limi DSM 17137]|uniref:Uncharacterized protein n=1 Tax=Devosia limi DSM 17137 TaxID=1121477 RepID=A0A0F5LRD7_9HYPH|nr:hypothetical protein [Devosia limi]KKB84935.1 hypothetical protein VW29_08960 [Devosia limi DSM 17137]SHF04774.1 hypothetical protein SAMN02745223_01669 [Devosia limi DSM 17137]